MATGWCRVIAEGVEVEVGKLDRRCGLAALKVVTVDVGTVTARHAAHHAQRAPSHSV